MKWSLQHTSKSLGVDGRCRQSDDENKENKRGSGVSLGHRDGWTVARFVCYRFACCRVKNEAAKQRTFGCNLLTLARSFLVRTFAGLARLAVRRAMFISAVLKLLPHSSCFVLTHEGSDENEMSVSSIHFCCSSTTPFPPTTER